MKSIVSEIKMYWIEITIDQTLQKKQSGIEDIGI